MAAKVEVLGRSVKVTWRMRRQAADLLGAVEMVRRLTATEPVPGSANRDYWTAAMDSARSELARNIMDLNRSLHLSTSTILVSALYPIAEEILAAPRRLARV